MEIYRQRVSFLIATTVLVSGISVGSQTIAAPAVTGTAGCVVRNGYSTTFERRQETNVYNTTPYVCTSIPAGQTTDGLILGNFVSAGEINSAFVQMESYVNNQITTVINNMDNSEQVAIDASQNQQITNLDNRVTTIEGQVVNLDNRVTKVEGQVTDIAGALGGGAQINPDGTFQKPEYIVAGKNYDNVGDALSATNQASVQYSVDADGNRTNNIVLTGSGTGPVGIHNVADGVIASDAANYGQVTKARDEAMAYTDEKFAAAQTENSGRFDALSGEIAQTRTEARGGISSAMAMAALRYDESPGKWTIASGFGNFKGSSSLTTGFGYTSEDARFRFNAAVSYGFSSQDLSWNAGASWTLN
jgi:autotransporter adhesin